MTTKRRIGIGADGRTNDAIDSRERKKLRKEKMKERCESEFRELYLESTYRRVRCNPETTPS